MSTIISLSNPELDWEMLVRMVEQTGAPLWLELNGVVQGVLLPAVNARRLLGRYIQTTRQQDASAEDGMIPRREAS
jgi:hypothetical protein